MRQLRQTLRLHLESRLSLRECARVLGISKTTVGAIVSMARVAGVDWAVVQALTDDELESRVYRPAAPRSSRHLEPDFALIHQELRRPGVSLQLLWEQYQRGNDLAYKYTAFCVRYRAWAAALKRSMRQTHVAGEKLFVLSGTPQPACITNCRCLGPEWRKRAVMRPHGAPPGGLNGAVSRPKCNTVVNGPRLLSALPRGRRAFPSHQMAAARSLVHRDLAGFDFEVSSVDRKLVTVLASCEFTAAAHNAVLVGGSGTGKSHLATAIGMAGITEHGKRAVRFYSTVDLVNALEREKAEG